MNTIIKNIALALSLCSAYPTQAQVGQRCEPGDIPPRPGLTCQATGEWEYQPSYILNAKKGEIILSSANGMIGGVLRHVSPPQRYSHSGMIVQRAPMLVRHSTASEERYKDHVVSVGEGIVANYIEPAVLQYGWPGVITETIDETYFGTWQISPEGKAYFMRGFNRNTVEHPETAIVYPVVVKPLPDPGIWDELSSVVLESFARAADRMSGHYRAFAYTKGDLVGDSSYFPTDPTLWPFGGNRDASVCSTFLWSAVLAGSGGVPPEDPAVEPGDRMHPTEPELAGLYVYLPAERRAAAGHMYTELRNAMLDRAHGELWYLGDALVTLSGSVDDIANQVCNCFASDSCSADAARSDSWRRDPGQGIAVSPDDILNWDAPPDGFYGHHQTMDLRPGRWRRVYTWQPSAGTGSAVAEVRYGGVAFPSADVRLLVSGIPGGSSDSSGLVRFEAVPSGRYDVTATAVIRVGDAERQLNALNSVNVTAGTENRVQLDLSDGPVGPPPGTRSLRAVGIAGLTHINDYEFWADDEADDWPDSQAVSLDPVNRLATVHFTHFTGDEIRTETTIDLEFRETRLFDVPVYNVFVNIRVDFFEGTSSGTDDRDGHYEESFLLIEDQTDINKSFRVSSGEDEDDYADFSFTFQNVIRP